MHTVAELHTHHSRANTPTRRVAVGEHRLVWTPSGGNRVGYGTMLIAAVIAERNDDLDVDTRAELRALARTIAQRRGVPRTYVRHRVQTDTTGLTAAHHRLVTHTGGIPWMDARVDTHAGTATQHALCAIYATATAPRRYAHEIASAVETALEWRYTTTALIDHLAHTGGDTHHWALRLLGLDTATDRVAVNQAWRARIRDIHPDRGGDPATAAALIDELNTARDALLHT